MLKTKALVFTTILTCLFALLPACSRQPDSHGPVPELEPLYRSSKALESALAVGVSYQELSGLVRQMSLELYLLSDRVQFEPQNVNERAKRLLPEYVKLLEIYADSARVWSLQIQNRDYTTDMEDLAKKYGAFKLLNRDNRVGVDFDAIRQLIWEKAGQQQKRLNGLYRRA